MSTEKVYLLAAPVDLDIYLQKFIIINVVRKMKTNMNHPHPEELSVALTGGYPNYNSILDVVNCYILNTLVTALSIKRPML